MTLSARLRDPRRLLAIALIALTFGLVLAFLWARGDQAGSDAYAYWTAVHRWLAGEDIYQVVPGLYVTPTEGALPYAYSPWSLYVFLPWALLPWNIAWIVWRVAIIALFGLSVFWAYDRRPLGHGAVRGRTRAVDRGELRHRQHQCLHRARHLGRVLDRAAGGRPAVGPRDRPEVRARGAAAVHAAQRVAARAGSSSA